jgi:hypothetical protein
MRDAGLQVETRREHHHSQAIKLARFVIRRPRANARAGIVPFVRILDHDNNEIASVALYLNEHEAASLGIALIQMLVDRRDDPQWHAHVSDETFSTEITVYRDIASPP